ncbi:MAG: phosphoadenylyl-sulfate reductase [Sphingopyxis sp.]
MAEARVRDRINIGPRYSEADAIRLNQMFRGRSTGEMLDELISQSMLGDAAIVSSFGAESAVLLHLLGSIEPGIAVIFLDTGKHFPETLTYRDTLIAAIGLTNVINVTPDPTLLASHDATDLRWSYDPDGCCDIRKVQPLARALAPFDAQYTGRKAFQSATRSGLPRFEVEGGRLKVNPLADWDKAAINAYMTEHALPVHPLVAGGYPSIGCAPCTSRVRPGEDPRAGRWRGWEKTECGLHGEVTPLPLNPDGSEDPIF